MPSAELFQSGATFIVGETTLQAEPFWYSDDAAWAAFLDMVEDWVQWNDAWGLLAMRPDMDVVLIDVLGDWKADVKRFNGRAIKLVYPSDRQTIDQAPAEHPLLRGLR